MFNEDDKVKDNQSFGLFSFMNEQSDKDDSELTDLQKEAIQKNLLKKVNMIHGILKKMK